MGFCGFYNIPIEGVSYCSHFKGEETEAQRVKMICLGTGCQMAEPGLEGGSLYTALSRLDQKSSCSQLN